jgi:Tfp pilus assembly protein PilZ
MKQRIPRKSLRHPSNLEVLEVDNKRVTETYVKDLSTSGCKLETPSLYSVMRLIKVKIKLPAVEKEFILDGRVVWARPVFQRPGRFVLGVKFHMPSWELESLLRSKGSG